MTTAGAAGEQREHRMTHTIEQTEEEILSFQVSDEALEAAAGSVKENAGAFTLAFCSGLDTCPA
jgi:hypothetical protein